MAKDTYRVMITSLYGGGPKDTVDYYNVREGGRYLYCDAILSAEASCKYILSNYNIDEIITLGSKSTYDPGDELVQMVLREGSSFYASDINKLSAYSLLRYRLAQYLDDLRIEEQDLRDLLSEDEQKLVTETVRNSFRKLTQGDADAKFNRFFDMLDMDENLKSEFIKDVTEQLEPVGLDENRLQAWVMNYLYSEMRPTSKMVALDSNNEVKIRFIPTDAGGTLSFAYTLSAVMKETEEAVNCSNYELYICIQSEDADDTYTLMNFMDLVKVAPGNRMKVTKVVTSSRQPGEVASEIKDSTQLYGVSELLAGMRTFLRSGKTDILTRYWKDHGTGSEYIDRLLAAMRNIDIGISLCDISDIERGIVSLRRLFSESDFEPGDSIVEQYFDFIIRAIKADYGKLLTDDETGMIDLVKWAYRKGFWQQTLTLIESKAPEDFITRGIYYYCDSKESKENAIRVLGGIYYDLKPFEKYKLDDISHYFVKFYGRGRVGHLGSDAEHAQKYAKLRIEDIHTNDPDTVKAFTGCSDEAALGNLLFAYYMLGFVRNETNHAVGDAGGYSLNVKDTDVSERLNTIKRSIESFITGYERVLSVMGDTRPDVWRISNEEVKDFAKTLKPYFNKHDDRGNGDRRNGGYHNGGGQQGGYHNGGGNQGGGHNAGYRKNHSGGQQGGYHKDGGHQGGGNNGPENREPQENKDTQNQ